MLVGHQNRTQTFRLNTQPRHTPLSLSHRKTTIDEQSGVPFLDQSGIASAATTQQGKAHVPIRRLFQFRLQKLQDLDGNLAIVRITIGIQDRDTGLIFITL